MRQQDLYTLCQSDPVLQHLQLSKAWDQLQISTFVPEQGLDLAEQDVYFLIRGYIKMGHLDTEGNLHIAQYLQGPKVFNLIACLEKKALYYDYFAMSSAQLLKIPQAVFLQQLQDNPALKNVVFDLLSSRLWQNVEAQHYQVAGTFKQRIAYQLLKLHEQQTAKGDIKISQQQFADLLQVSRQTLHKQLGVFLQLGFIEWRYHRVKILNLSALAEWASW